MKHMLSAWLSLLLIAAMPSTSYSDVIFNWYPISYFDTITSVSAQLVVRKSAWNNDQGHLATNYLYPYLDPGIGAFPESPIVSVKFTVNGAHLFIDPIHSANFGYLIADLQFGTGTVSGSLSADNLESTIDLSGNTLWTIWLFASDVFPSHCYEPPYCAGATGQWVIDPASVLISEPATLPLFTLGLAVLGCLFYTATVRTWRKSFL